MIRFTSAKCIAWPAFSAITCPSSGFPINRSFRAHIQLFHGYGESLIDYNHKATYFGLGISLLDWY